MIGQFSNEWKRKRSAFDTERRALNPGRKLTVKDEFKVTVQELLKQTYFQKSRFWYQLRLCLDKELLNINMVLILSAALL